MPNKLCQLLLLETEGQHMQLVSSSEPIKVAMQPQLEY